MEPITQVAIGLLVAVLAAPIVAVITRRFNPGSGGDRNAIAIDGSTVSQDITYSPTHITNYQTVQSHIQHNASGGKSSSDDDDAGMAMVGVVVMVLLATLFAVYANWALMVSVFAVVTMVVVAANLVATTRQRFGKLPEPAVWIIMHVGLVIAFTATVWGLVLTIERSGTSLGAAVDFARDSGSRLPVSPLIDEFGFAGILLLAMFAAAVVFTFVFSAIVWRDLVNWWAMLSVPATLEAGKTPRGWKVRLAKHFDQTKPKSVVPTLTLGAIAIVFASGLVPAMLDRVPTPEPVSVVTPYQR